VSGSERLVRIRIMGPREVVDRVTERLQAVPELSLAEVSPAYANRKDDGVRRYLTGFVEDRPHVG
jgi:hypothetical protein